jgi:glutathione S-transferase
MIVLHGCGAQFGLPEASPYVTKTEVHLQMAGLPYVKETTRPEMSPKGQLPFIEDEGEVIADSHFIRLHLERKYGVDFDEGLCPVGRAQAWAIERMLENHFGWTMAGIRWLDNGNFAKGPAAFFAALPEEARAAVIADVRRQIRENVRTVGIGRHSEAEVLGLGVRSLQALSALLGDKPFMMGERPTSVDAAAFGMLAGLMTPFFDAPLRQRAMTFENLTAYVDRMMAGVFPSFAWTPLFKAPAFVEAA